jgi:ATP-dependent Clp protease adaptor protein ClpS
MLGEAVRVGASGSGGSSPPQDPTRESEGGVATQTRSKTARPQRYKVLLYNDDYTPMEFVVTILEQVFGKSPAAATQIMLAVHRTGIGVAGVFILELAETKAGAVHRAAESRGYPLRSGVEKE